MELYEGVKISIGPPIEDGFYYDFEFPDGAAVSEADFPRDRRAHARARQGRRAVRARGRVRRAGARALRRRAPGLQGRADRRPRHGRRAEPASRAAADGLALHQRSLHRPLPRAARAEHQDDRRLQAELARRRLLARRLDEDDAHAHLRHRLLLARPSSRSTSSASSRPRRATTASSGASSGCSRSPRSRPEPPSGCPPAPACSTRSSASRARWAPSAATARSRRRRSSTPSCGRPPVTGASTARTCSRCRSRSARWRVKPMNCPGALPAVRHSAATPTATCRSATPSPASLHRNEASGVLHGLLARAPLRPGRRAHLLHRGAGRRTRSRLPARWPSTPTSCSTSTSRLELSTRPEQRVGTDEMWDRAEDKLDARARRARPRLRAEPRRRRLLRPEDRHAHDRLARALLAARHGAARLLDARALRAQLHRRRQRRSTAR